MSLVSCSICHEPLLTPGVAICQQCRSGLNGQRFAAHSGAQAPPGKVSPRQVLGDLGALTLAGSALTWLEACANSALGSGTTPTPSTKTPPKLGTTLVRRDA